jgi:hypothetical protein
VAAEKKNKAGTYGVIGAIILLGIVLWFSLGREPEEAAPQPIAPPVTHPDAEPPPPPEPPDAGAEVAVLEPVQVDKAPPRTPKAALNPASRKITVPSATPSKKSGDADAGEEAAGAEAAPIDAGAPTEPDAGAPGGPPDAAEPAPAPRFPITIVFREELDWLKATQIDAAMDGHPIANKRSVEGFDTKEPLPVYGGDLAAGQHRLNLIITFIGDSKVFSYLEGYKFTVKHNATIKTHEGKTSRIVISVIQRGNMTQDWKDRVALKVDVE